MIYIIGILAIIGIIAFIFTLLVKVYNDDQKTQDERVLVLEKRQNDTYKELCNLEDYINDKLEKQKDLTKELELRLQKLERKTKVSKWIKEQ